MPTPDLDTALVDEIIASARGEIEVRLSAPTRLSEHTLTLSRAGVLRRSRDPRDVERSEQLGVHPTPALPGVLLRLAAIAPLGGPPEGSDLDLPEELLDQLAAPDDGLREAAWSRALDAARALPAPADPALEAAPPRAVHLVRRRAEGDAGAVLVQLRGRYLVADPASAGRLVGATPTDAARALLRPLLTARG